MIDVIASEPQFVEHLRPIWDALPEEHRGRLLTGRELERLVIYEVQGSRPVLVASHGDMRRARALGRTRLAYLEHGAGQSYGGDPESARHASYAGGADHDDVELFLVPGPHPAARWRQAYPAARVEVIGCPRLDRLPALEPDMGPPIVALSFHYHAMAGCPESNGLFDDYRALIPSLARQFRLIGHAHPRWANRVRPWFERAHVPFVASFADVCRQASLYVVDNSSTLFEFAATGRPVVALDGPKYRRTVEHGLRFWSAAHVGHHALPENVGDVIAQALEDDVAEAREDALAHVYAYRSGAPSRAVGALTAWLEDEVMAA